MNINRVIITGNLTREPELRSAGETSVCKLGIAVNTRRKQQGEWVDKPNFFRVTVFGRQAESCAQYLSKGRPIAVDGRLEWSSWETQDGQRRESVDIVADTVQFLGGRDDGNGRTAEPDIPIAASDFEPQTQSPADEDEIPF